jgi:hypothetical protein
VIPGQPPLELGVRGFPLQTPAIKASTSPQSQVDSLAAAKLHDPTFSVRDVGALPT